MEAKLIEQDFKGITIQVSIPLSGNMLSSEELIQQGVNLAGLLATEHLYYVPKGHKYEVRSMLYLALIQMVLLSK